MLAFFSVRKLSENVYHEKITVLRNRKRDEFFFLLGLSADLQIYWWKCLVLHHCFLSWHPVCSFYSLAITFCSEVQLSISKKRASFAGCIPFRSSAGICQFVSFFPLIISLLSYFSCSKEPMDIKSDYFALTLPCLLSWFKICIFRSFFFSGRTFYNCLTVFNIMGPAARLLPLTNHKGND